MTTFALVIASRIDDITPVIETITKPQEPEKMIRSITAESHLTPEERDAEGWEVISRDQFATRAGGAEVYEFTYVRRYSQQTIRKPFGEGAGPSNAKRTIATTEYLRRPYTRN